ncbi:fungal-specific transcription factor domain-containing protein [Mycena olivaceomarginata]|nr:fungal-specific transcription factor domain-containing protein [Mycena olivaceomarginata]
MANLDCTYVEVPAKRRPPKSVLDLEARLEHSEAQLERSEELVRRLRAELTNAHFSTSSTNTPSSNSSTLSENERAPYAPADTQSFDASILPIASLSIMRATLHSLTAPPVAPHADDVLDLEIANEFEKLSVGTQSNIFFGKGSGVNLVNAALDFTRKEPQSRRFSDDSPDDSRGREGGGTWTSRRPRYWTWKTHVSHPHTFKFPSDTEMGDLVELYFARQNIYLPLLHRPIFERAIADGLHLRDDGFAGTVLLVCAIGSRWSTGPGVCDPSLDCGWDFFNQVQLAGGSLLRSPTLYDLQHYCLAAQFLVASSMPHIWWTLVGVGLRLAQGFGAHRGKARTESPSVEHELQKRAFWVLVYLDRLASCILGRMSSVNYFEFDVDLPLEVDDEYWEDEKHPFQQPAHKPSRIEFFNVMMRLNHILGFSLKILYPLKKERTAFSINDSWLEQAIIELDSAFNDWRDQIPDHLRWDPMLDDPVFFDQSVALHCAFYHLQIVIHRPFIPMTRPASTGLPSLVICTNAARALANVVDVQRRYKGNIPRPLNLPMMFTSGMVLLLNILSSKRSGLLADPKREIANVHKCMDVIRLCESRWQLAGMLGDVLGELASFCQLPPSHTRAGEPNADNQPPADVIFDTLPGSRSLRQPDIQPPQHEAPFPPFPSSLFASGDPTDPEIPDFVLPNPMPTSSTSAIQPEDDTYTDPAQASRELAAMMNHLDRDVMAVWTNAPTGLGAADWGAYFSYFSEST